jgi:hypothetical protein
MLVVLIPFLDDPEQLGVGPPPDGIAQIRRLRIEALSDIPRILLRRTVAVNAGVSIDAESVTLPADRGELKGSGYLWRMTLHGMMHGRGQEPLKDSGFRQPQSPFSFEGYQCPLETIERIPPFPGNLAFPTKLRIILGVYWDCRRGCRVGE